MLVCHQPLTHLSVAVDRPIVGFSTSDFNFQMFSLSTDFNLENQNLFSRSVWVYFELHMSQ